MPHVCLPEGLPGIRGPMAFRPETAKPLNDLVDILLRGPHPLSPGERELIASYVSCLNDCQYCQTIHGAIAAHHLGGKAVRTEDIQRARQEGASDLEIHDTVLIAAMFCMCNRYVDGLATWAPTDPTFYRDRAAKIAVYGYAASTIPALAAADV
jgi:AhpD family alkylhydroperoxidase